MSDRAALLAAVGANPDDDTPRLVLADWQDDNGEADRATYIRAAIAVARLVGNNDRDGTAADNIALNAAWRAEREAQVVGKKWWAWYGPGDRVHVLRWSRGFVDELATTAATWLEVGDQVLGEHPALRRVRLTTWPEVEYGSELDGEWHRWRSGPGIRFRFVGDPLGRLFAYDEVDTRRARVGPEYAVAGDGPPDLPLTEHRPFIAELCRLRWPGIEFELPPAVDVTAVTEAVRRMGETMVAAGRAMIPAFAAVGEAMRPFAAALSNPALVAALAEAESDDTPTA